MMNQIIQKIEALFLYYQDNRQELYRPFCWLVAGLHLLVAGPLMMSTWTLIQIEGLPATAVYATVLGAFTMLVVIALAIRSITGIPAKRPDAITLFAVLVGYHLFTGSVLIALIGAYCLFNKKFAESVIDWAPEWYQRAVKWGRASLAPAQPEQKSADADQARDAKA